MVYTFIGENSLVDKEIEEILKKETNIIVTKYDLEEINILKVLEDINTISLFQEKKVIICTNLNKITNINEEEAIIKYLNNKNNNILIFKEKEKLSSSKQKLVKELQEKSTYIEVNNNESLFSFIKNSFDDYKISNINISLLKEYCNNDFYRIKQEIEKLKMYKLEEKEILKEDIIKVVKKGFDKNIFDLLNAINRKNKKDMYKTYYELLENNEDEIKIISILANNFKLIYKVKKLKETNTDENIIKMLKLHPYRLKLLKEQTYLYSEEELLRIIVDLSNLDISIKSGEIDKKIGLELFLAKI